MSHFYCRKFLFIWFYLHWLTLIGYAQVEIPVLEGPIIIDGLSDEPAWDDIEPVPLVTYKPVFGKAPSEKTEIRIGHDESYLYISGRMYDSDPGGIQGNSLIRDVDRGGDFFNVFLDTYNDNENMLVFMTTPTGNRMDAEVLNDAEGTDFWNNNWNSFWDNAVVQTPEGWFAEMRIPFSSLKFQDDQGKVVFGLIVHRLINRKNERLIYPAIPPNWSFAKGKPSQAQDVLIEGVYRKNPVYFTPYILGGLKTLQKNSGSAHNKFEKEAGFDLKYGLSSNLTLDVTVNTDFAQVETDLERVNFSRFSLFFPEKRQFFQERSGIFNFKTGGESRLFHSRRIGLSPTGDPIRILGGVRLAGRINQWDIGLLNMQTGSSELLPSENFGLLRIRRRVINSYSYLGGMFTSRVGSNGQTNLNYGLDGVVRLFGSDYLTLRWAQTSDISSSGNLGESFIDRSLVYSKWERRTSDGLGYAVEVNGAGPLYDPGIGFIAVNDFVNTGALLWYGWSPERSSLIFRHSPYFNTSFGLVNRHNVLGGNIIQAGWKVEMMSGSAVNISLFQRKEKLIETFELENEIRIPIGEHSFERVRIKYEMSPSRLFRSNFEMEFGRFFDGTQWTVSLSPVWNISRHLEIEGGYEYNQIEFSGRNQLLRAHLGRVNLTYALNNHFSTKALIQFNSLDKRWGANIKLRYNFQEGQDLYLVYNEVKRSTLQQLEGTAQFPDSRAISLKYTYTFLRI